MKGIVVDLEDADLPILALPDDKYTAFFPTPLCEHRHDSPADAFECIYEKQRFIARSRAD